MNQSQKQSEQLHPSYSLAIIIFFVRMIMAEEAEPGQSVHVAVQRRVLTLSINTCSYKLESSTSALSQGYLISC